MTKVDDDVAWIDGYLKRMNDFDGWKSHLKTKRFRCSSYFHCCITWLYFETWSIKSVNDFCYYDYITNDFD